MSEPVAVQLPLDGAGRERELHRHGSQLVWDDEEAAGERAADGELDREQIIFLLDLLAGRDDELAVRCRKALVARLDQLDTAARLGS